MMKCDPVQTAQFLAQAKSAYHALMTGTQPRVIVDQNGERVEYTATNSRQLLNYITQLENQAQSGCGQAGSVSTPMGFTF